MDILSNEIVRDVFREERNRFIRFLSIQKRHLWFWQLTLLILLCIPIVANFQSTLRYLYISQQYVFNVIVICWIFTIVLMPFLWPRKPGDYFHDDFKRGLNPRVWEYDGNWKVELDENSGPILSVSNSDRGGLVLNCLSWTDYEVQFEARIMTEWIGWIIRASSLNDYVHQKLGATNIHTLYKMTGVIQKVGELEHGLLLERKKWYPIRLLARGEWLSVYIKLDDKEHLIFQDQALGEKPPVTIEYTSKVLELPVPTHRQILTPSYRSGSFGFRLHDVEHAHYRRLRAYRL